MFETMMMNLLTQPKIVGAVDIFQSITNAGQTTKNNLMVISAIIAVVSIIVGGLMFAFGRRGAENGKSHIFNVIMGVILIVAAASIVVSLFSMFGQTPQGI